MDPKQQLNKLDPKLQDAYNRVMGTAAPQTPLPQPPPVVPPSPVMPEPAPPPPPAVQPVPQVVTPPTPALTPAQEDTMAAAMPVAPAPAPAASGFVAASNANEGKKHGLSPITYIFGGFAFFIVYALVWIKIFHLSLPFLPQ